MNQAMNFKQHVRINTISHLANFQAKYNKEYGKLQLNPANLNL